MATQAQRTRPAKRPPPPVAWVVAPAEATDANGAGVGRWRLCFSADQPGLKVAPRPLCFCPGWHGSPEEAQDCPIARDHARAFTDHR